MKKILGKFIMAAMLIVVGIIGYGIYDKSNSNAELIKHLQYLPHITLTKVDNSKHTLSGNGRPTLIIYYASECQYCLDEFAQIKEFIAVESKVNFILLSTESIESIKAFASLMNLSQHSHVQFYQIDPETVLQNFGSFAAPRNLIYDRREKLVLNRKGPLLLQELNRILSKQ